MPWYGTDASAAQEVDAASLHRVEIVPSPSQHRIITSNATIVAAYSNTGEGKCHAPGSPILMHDGSIKAAEDVEVGDCLMGDDSTPRRVFSLARGVDEMYEVVPIKGEPFVVNGAHILCLKHTPFQHYVHGELAFHPKSGHILEISVREYLALSPKLRKDYKLYHAPVDFPMQSVALDPYWLGVWLGDGTSTSADITTADREVVDFLYAYASVMDAKIAMQVQPGNASSVYRPSSNVGIVSRYNPNKLFANLKAYGLLGNKHIPAVYRCNTREVRLALLAGLIDSDGSVNRSGYQILQKSEALARDIVYVARSLGFQCTVAKTTKTIKSRGFSGQYYRIYINGDCSIVPVKIPHKRVPPRLQKKDVLVTGIRAIHPIGLGDYCGFTLDGNCRYLMGDFLVTHNTWACIMALIYHAHRCGRPIRAAIIRDTYENIKSSVVPPFVEFFDSTQTPHKWHNEYRRLDIFTKPSLHVDLFGIDDLNAVTRLQGSEYAAIWLEEPAPYVDSKTTNAGLSEDVYNAALMRCARQKGTKARLQLSFNPPDEDHWVFRRVMSTPDGMVDPSTPLITKEVIRIPRGENTHLKEESRQAAIAAYKHDPAAYDRFVLGETSTRYAGMAVTGRAFAVHRHVAPMPLEPVEGMTGWIGWDSWMHPAAVLGQQFPDGRLWVLDVIVDTEDIRDLVRNYVNPLVMSPRWRDKCFAWRQIGDRTMRQPDQSNHGECAADVVENEFDPGMGATIPFELGPQTWTHIYTGIMHALRDSASGGQPKVLLCPSRTKPLIAGLRGRWHFATNRAGVLTQVTPVKDLSSHPCDAWANAVCVLAPWTLLNQSQYTKKQRFPQRRQRSLAQSYSTRLPVVV